jgi:hypothetical protein
MATRLLALALLIPACLFAIACEGDDTKDSQTVPSSNTPSVAATVAVTATSQPPFTPPPAVTPTIAPAGPTSTPIAPTAIPPPPATPRPPAVSAPAPSGSTISVPFPFDNAVLARESLLGTARFGGPMDSLDSLDPLDLKAYPGWNSTYPQLRIVGSSVNAAPQTVSVYRNLLRDNQPASATNPKVIVLAVMDLKGACAAGVVRGYPTYNEYVIIDIGSSPCNANAALAILRR